MSCNPFVRAAILTALKECLKMLVEIPPKTTTLYQLTDDLLAIERILEEAEAGGYDGAVIDQIRDRLDELAVERSKKLEACARMVRNYEAEREMCRVEAGRFSARASAADARMAHLKAYVKAEMERAKEQRLTAGPFRLRIQQNSVAPIDRARLDEDVLAGIEIAGAWTEPIVKINPHLVPDEYRLPKGSHLRIE